MTLILASASETRRRLLEEAGIAFQAVPADIDERAAEAPLLAAGAPPDDIAAALALVKAMDVSARFPDALVIGADQTLDLDGELLTKPADMEAARRQLLALSGRTHRLHAAVALVRNEEIVWQHGETVQLAMRAFLPEAVGRYLALAGERALSSVGAYQIEGPGIRLFRQIEGDYFAILGLPLLPLLDVLRAEGEIDW